MFILKLHCSANTKKDEDKDDGVKSEKEEVEEEGPELSERWDVVSIVTQPRERNYQMFLEDFEEYFGVLAPPHFLICSMTTKQNILEELKPKFVVMYDPDIGFFRQLEVIKSSAVLRTKVYKIEHPGIPLRVYWLWYTDSVEDKIYLETLEREKRAFDSLIDEKQVLISLIS